MSTDDATAELGPNAQRYVDAIVRAVEVDLGRPLPAATTIVASDDRSGSGAAVVYPLPGRTAIWCDPALATRLDPVASSEVLGSTDVVERAVAAGWELLDSGIVRVLDGRPSLEPAAPWRVAHLDRDREDDRAKIAAFIAECDDDDLEEAELELDDLDPVIVALLDEGGRIVSYASERPASFDEGFDDIAVITHPGHRRSGLGVRAVAALIDRRPADARFIYRCSVDNPGSNRIAESLGFAPVLRLSAIRPGSDAPPA